MEYHSYVGRYRRTGLVVRAWWHCALVHLTCLLCLPRLPVENVEKFRDGGGSSRCCRWEGGQVDRRDQGYELVAVGHRCRLRGAEVVKSRVGLQRYRESSGRELLYRGYRFWSVKKMVRADPSRRDQKCPKGVQTRRRFGVLCGGTQDGLGLCQRLVNVWSAEEPLTLDDIYPLRWLRCVRPMPSCDRRPGLAEAAICRTAFCRVGCSGMYRPESSLDDVCDAAVVVVLVLQRFSLIGSSRIASFCYTWNRVDGEFIPTL